LPRLATGPGGLAMTSLNRFLHSLRSVGMTHDTGSRNEETPPAGGGANQFSGGKNRTLQDLPDERLPRPCGPRNDEFSGGKNRTLQDYGLSQGGGPYGLDGEDHQEAKNQAQQSE